MLSNQKVKYIKSLQVKKYRQKHRAFLVEGAKSVFELLDSPFSTELIVATEQFIEENEKILSESGISVIAEKQRKIESIGTLKTNNAAVAVVSIPERQQLNFKDELVVLLDRVKDPGNLGTIMRTADWYGVQTVIASPDSSDCYNPRTIQASMGSFTRVQCIYNDLIDFISSNSHYRYYATVMNGGNLHQATFKSPCALVLGNESEGISEQVLEKVKYRVSIPRYGKAESLNVAMATGILLDNCVRQMN